MLGCGTHTAFIMERGGVEVVGELEKITKVEWDRRRDDISIANVFVSFDGACPNWMGNVESGGHNELHIYRNGVPVWQGPLTRIEYRQDAVEFYASDILWIAKNSALTKGYSHKWPNIAAVGWVMNQLLRERTFMKHGDPWNGVDGIRWLVGPDEPKTSRVTAAWSTTTWEDFDRFAEDSGMDYTVVGRDILFWDTHYKWATLPDLVEAYLTQTLAVVEYGNEFATRIVVTNGKGQAGLATAPAWGIKKYGYIDHVVNSWNEAAGEKATPEELAAWTEQARALLRASFPAPVRVRVSEGTGLRPDAPYDINDLVAGKWLTVVCTSVARAVTQLHKLDRVHVIETSGTETVSISTVAAPLTVVE